MSAATAHPEGAAPPRRRTPWQLWVIAAVSVAPLIFSFVAYQLWRPSATTNHGALLEARALPDAPLRRVDGSVFRLSELKGKWLLVMADSGSCDAWCERKLYTIRQLRLAHGKGAGRIERVWLVTDEAVPAAAALNGYEGTHVARAAGSEVLAALPAASALNDHMFIVDPLGNAVLRYGRDAEPSRMIKDISRLLKASRVE